MKKLAKRKKRVMKNYFMQCCDCGLIHRMNFRVVIKKNGMAAVQFQAFRAARASRGEPK